LKENSWYSNKKSEEEDGEDEKGSEEGPKES